MSLYVMGKNDYSCLKQRHTLITTVSSVHVVARPCAEESPHVVSFNTHDKLTGSVPFAVIPIPWIKKQRLMCCAMLTVRNLENYSLWFVEEDKFFFPTSLILTQSPCREAGWWTSSLSSSSYQ